jgi:hypothetical protein
LKIVSFSLNINGSQIIQNPIITNSIKAILIIKLTFVVDANIPSKVEKRDSKASIITLHMMNL